MGRYSNAKRAELAAKAAEAASKAVQVAEPAQVEPEGQSPEKPVVQAPRWNPRDDVMDEVIARHERVEEPKAEEPKAEEPKVEPKPEAKPEEKPEPVAKVEPEAPKVEPEAPKVEEAPKSVRVKVDGEEFEVPQSDIDEAGGLVAYRLNRAAENRLRKINDILSKSHQAAPATPPQPQITDDAFIASKIDIIRFGTPEESAAALREVMQRQNPKQDNSLVINQAVTQIKRDTAIAKFKAEFSEIVSTPLLMKLAGTLENETLAQLNPQALANPQFVSQFDWDDFYRRIGNQVRGAVGRQSQPAQPPQTNGTPSPSPDKEARKASIVNLPTAAARAAIPEEAKPETRADILNDMRKARGLPTE